MSFKITRVASAALACVSLLAGSGIAQSPAHSFISVLQGKEIPIPADYVGKYEEQKKELLVSLDSLGLAQSQGDDVSVVLVRADGTTETQKANANGEFVFNEITNGLASLVVTGKQTYAAMSVFVDSLASLTPDAAVPQPGELPPLADRGAFRIPTISNFDPNEVSLAVKSAGTAQQGASLKPLSFYKPAPASRFQVKLVNGTLQGKVVVPEDGYDQQPGRFNVTILKDGKVVGSTASDESGNFYVRLTSTGVHSIIASGPAGHAAFSFEVLDGGQTAANWQATTRLVATLPAPGETLYVLVIPPRMMPAVQQVVSQAYPTTPPPQVVDGGFPMDAGFPPAFPGGFPGGFAGGAAGGAAGGGMGGGLGGGGGGGALGGLGRLPIGALLGVGGLAAGVAALSSNDSNFSTAPASIIVP